MKKSVYLEGIFDPLNCTLIGLDIIPRTMPGKRNLTKIIEGFSHPGPDVPYMGQEEYIHFFCINFLSHLFLVFSFITGKDLLSDIISSTLKSYWCTLIRLVMLVVQLLLLSPEKL